jgi:hypothetical protein
MGKPSQSAAYNGMVHRTKAALGWLEGGCVAGGGVASSGGWVLNYDVLIGSSLLVCIPLLLGVLSSHHRGRQGT